MLHQIGFGPPEWVMATLALAALLMSIGAAIVVVKRRLRRQRAWTVRILPPGKRRDPRQFDYQPKAFRGSQAAQK